jgi:hypothetical protein
VVPGQAPPPVTQMYFGADAASGLIKSVVNDDAVKLKTVTDLVVAKYLPMSPEQLQTALATDFPDHHDIDGSTMAFWFSDMPEISFMLLAVGDGANGLSVVGRDRYAGFRLFVSHELRWHCSVRDGIGYAATAGARKLAQLMERRFGVRDITRFLAGAG